MCNFVEDLFDRLGELKAVSSFLSWLGDGAEGSELSLTLSATAAEAAKLATYNKKSTISSREVQTGESSRLPLPSPSSR